MIVFLIAYHNLYCFVAIFNVKNWIKKFNAKQINLGILWLTYTSIWDYKNIQLLFDINNTQKVYYDKILV